MTGTIIVEGDPVSVNAMYRHSRGRSYMTDKGAAWKNIISWGAKLSWKGPCLATRLQVTLKLYFRGKGRHDLDNTAKGPLDAIQGIVYEDDSQIDDLRIVRGHDPKRPRIEISITEIF